MASVVAEKPTFHIGSIPVKVHYFFWIVAVLLSNRLTPFDVRGVAIWVGCMFVSIMVHELGHALVGRAFGLEPAILLYSFGGLTMWSGAPGQRTRLRSIAISFAGPGAGFLLATLVVVAELARGHGRELGLIAASFFAPVSPPPGLSTELVRNLLFINVGWSVMNLLPVIPLDGGHVLEAILRTPDGVKGQRRALILSIGVGAATAAAAFAFGYRYTAFLFGLLAYQAFARMRQIGATHADVTSGAAADLARADALLRLGDHAQALELADRVRTSARDDQRRAIAGYIAAQALIALGRDEEALVRIPSDGSEPSLVLRAQTLFRVGRFREAATECGTLFRRTRRPEHAVDAARAHARDGEPEDAVEWLDQALKAGATDPREWRDDPDLGSLAGNPRFDKLTA